MLHDPHILKTSTLNFCTAWEYNMQYKLMIFESNEQIVSFISILQTSIRMVIFFNTSLVAPCHKKVTKMNPIWLPEIRRYMAGTLPIRSTPKGKIPCVFGGGGWGFVLFLFSFLFEVLRQTREFCTHMEPSPLLVKGCKIWPMLDTVGHWAVRDLYL